MPPRMVTKITPRDGRWGLPKPSPMNRDQVIARLRHLPPDATLPAIVEALREWHDEGEARVPTAVPSPEEVLLWLATPTDHQHALILRTFYSGGMRSSELQGLAVADLHGDGLFIRSGKYDADRYILLDPTTAGLLREWTAGRALSEPIFRITNTTLQRHVAKWAEKCGLRQKYAALGQRICSHSLRFAFTTHCWDRGMEFAVLQRLLGHQLGNATNYYIRSTIEQRAAHYHRALGRGGFSGGGQQTPGAPERDEVIEFILRELPATAELETVLEALARWLLSLAKAHHREFMQQLQGEVPAHELLGGRRLPLILTRAELAALLEAGGLAARFLYRSLLFASQLDEVTGVDPETGIVHLKKGTVVVDLETAREVAEQGVPSAAGLAEAAERTGVAARFRAVGREFTPTCLRHTGATHLLEAGLDPATLHELLGNFAFVTTEFYYLTASERWRAEYGRAHPLMEWPDPP